MKTRFVTHIAPFSLAVAFGALAAGCGSATSQDGVQAPATQVGTTTQPASSSSAPATAADDHHGKREGRHHGGLFRQFDENGDGKVALADLPEPMRERFKAADTNADGILTRDEVKAAREAHHAKMEADLDTNGDGVVSDEERKAGREKFEEMWQKHLDTNGDGTVSDDERKAGREKFRDMWIARHDTNHDGALSADEVGPKMWSRISSADANKDGRVDRAEMATLPERPRHRPFSG
jgi:Ca2+-binding EF-hand superfamily protein